MSFKPILITNKDQASSINKSKDKLIKLNKETLHKSQSQSNTSFLPPIKNRRVLKVKIKHGMYDQFKESIDKIREEANEIKSSLNQINSRCRNFSKRLLLSKSNHHTAQVSTNPSRLTSLLNSNNTSIILSPRNSNSNMNSNNYCNGHSVNREDKQKKFRIRNFTVYPIAFKKKIGFPVHRDKIIFNKKIVNNMDFQMKYINDELNVIFSNYEYFKKKYICNQTIKKLFNSIDPQTQKTFNSTLEEVIGLVIELPIYILGNFYNKIDQFIEAPPLNLDYLNNKEVKDEALCFIENYRLMFKAFSFLLSTQEMYQTLLPEVSSKELLIAYEHFDITRGYLERIRYNINSLMEITDTQIRNRIKDRESIRKFDEDIEGRIKQSSTKNSTDLIQKISGLWYIPSHEDIKINRINNVLNLTKTKSSRNSKEMYKDKDKSKSHSKDKEIKEQNKFNSLIRSPYIKSMFKYFNPELQNKILALKSYQKKSSSSLAASASLSN